MPYEVRTERASPRALAAVRATPPVSRLGAHIVRLLDLVWPVLREQGVTTGHNVVIYYPGEGGVLTIDAGVEALTDFTDRGQVRHASTSSGEAATAAHYGDYSTMSRAYGALESWCQDNGRRPAGVNWEVYGDWDEDPANVRTDVYMLLDPAYSANRLPAPPADCGTVNGLPGPGRVCWIPDVSWPLRRNRDFAIFFCTQGISNIGDAARNLLIPLFVLQLTHDPLQVSAVAALEIATFIGLRIPFGALSDRRERRGLMLGADLARTVLTLAIPVTSALHGPTLPVIYAVIVPLSAASALFDSGADGAVPLLVPEESRGAAYGLTESAESVAWVIGPPAGGLLALLLGTGEALGLDSASFLVSVAGLLAIRTRFEPAGDAAKERLWESTRAGLKVIISNVVLRRDQIIWALYSVLGGSIVLGLVYVGTRDGSKDTILGSLALAAYAAGSAVGTLAAGALKPPTPWRAMAGGLLTAAVGASLVATQAGAAVLTGAALFGFGEGLLLVFHLTLRANATPDGYVGRVTGVSTVLAQVADLLSIGWLGLVLRFGHGRAAFVILGTALLALAAWVALAPKPAAAQPAAEQPPATLDPADSAPHPPQASHPPP